MSDENAEKAQIRAYNEITRADYTPESIEAAIGKLWRAAVASRDAEVLNDGLRESRIAELRKQLTAERTRADKAETEVTRLRKMLVPLNDGSGITVQVDGPVPGALLRPNLTEEAFQREAWRRGMR